MTRRDLPELSGGGEAGLRYGSVCSGIEAASVAWHPLGWQASFLSEIEPFPRAVLAHHYPETPLHGVWWVVGKGKLRDREPEYGAQLMFGADQVLGSGEGATAPLALVAAILRAVR